MQIAGRSLTLFGATGNIEIPIRIFAPVQQGNACSCRYEIDWPEGRETMEAWGNDTVQALELALRMIGADLYTSSYHRSGKLMFRELGNGYGFPVTNTLRDMLVGDDKRFF